MSLHYILDGYNIIKQSDFLATKKLRDARLDLVRFITQKKPCGSPNNKVTIVFDGTDDVNLPPTNNKRITVLFTRNSSADNRIKKIVEESENPKNIVVVTDDREIQFFIRACGAHPMKVAEFIQKAKPFPERPQKDSLKVELSYREAAEINNELARVWLK